MRNQWQYSYNQGRSFIDIANQTGEVLSLSGLQRYQDDYLYRYVTYDSNDNIINVIKPGKLDIIPSVNILQQPVDTYATNNIAQFTISLESIDNATFYIQWEIQKPGSHWELIPDENTNTLNLSVNDDALHGSYVRAKITATINNIIKSSVYTNKAQLYTINTSIKIIQQPVNSITNEETASFSVLVENLNNDEIKYSWQESSDGIVWKHIPNAHAAQLTVYEASRKHYFKYRCVIKNNNSIMLSNFAYIFNEIEITNPTNIHTTNEISGSKFYFRNNLGLLGQLYDKSSGPINLLEVKTNNNSWKVLGYYSNTITNKNLQYIEIYKDNRLYTEYSISQENDTSYNTYNIDNIITLHTATINNVFKLYYHWNPTIKYSGTIQLNGYIVHLTRSLIKYYEQADTKYNFWHDYSTLSDISVDNYSIAVNNLEHPNSYIALDLSNSFWASLSNIYRNISPNNTYEPINKSHINISRLDTNQIVGVTSDSIYIENASYNPTVFQYILYDQNTDDIIDTVVTDSNTIRILDIGQIQNNHHYELTVFSTDIADNLSATSIENLSLQLQPSLSNLPNHIYLTDIASLRATSSNNTYQIQWEISQNNLDFYPIAFYDNTLHLYASDESTMDSNQFYAIDEPYRYIRYTAIATDNTKIISNSCLVTLIDNAYIDSAYPMYDLYPKEYFNYTNDQININHQINSIALTYLSDDFLTNTAASQWFLSTFDSNYFIAMPVLSNSGAITDMPISGIVTKPQGFDLLNCIDIDNNIFVSHIYKYGVAPPPYFINKFPISGSVFGVELLSTIDRSPPSGVNSVLWYSSYDNFYSKNAITGISGTAINIENSDINQINILKFEAAFEHNQQTYSIRET